SAPCRGREWSRPSASWPAPLVRLHVHPCQATTTTRSGISSASASGLNTGARNRVNWIAAPYWRAVMSRVNLVPVPYWLAIWLCSLVRKWSFARMAVACLTSAGIDGHPHFAVTRTLGRRDVRVYDRVLLARFLQLTGNSLPGSAAIRS